MGTYLKTWGSSFSDTIQLLPHEELPIRSTFPAGTYIFSDLERLNPAQTRRAIVVSDRLRSAGLPVLNSPRETLRRFDLLRTLNSVGQNAFNAYRLSGTRRPSHFPVFLRAEREHGMHSKLLLTAEELDEEIEGVLSEGYELDDLLMIEFCDTSESDGVFRLYSAFCVRGQVIPRQLVFSRTWYRRQPDLSGPKRRKEEWDYLVQNPHAEQLRRISDIAKVDYGKIDYGLLDGMTQVWEINTNPIILMGPRMYAPVHLPAQEFFAEQIKEAFTEMNLPEEATMFSVTTAPVASRRPRRC